MGYGVGHRTYHTAVVRGPITQNIIPKTPMMLDEALGAFDDLIGTPVGIVFHYRGPGHVYRCP